MSRGQLDAHFVDKEESSDLGIPSGWYARDDDGYLCGQHGIQGFPFASWEETEQWIKEEG